MTDITRSSDFDDDLVEAAFAEYFVRLDRDGSVEVSEIIAAYPGCEGELRRFLDSDRHLRQALGFSLSQAVQEGVPGRILGDFQLLQVIGRGGMGVVWEAEQLSLRRRVAVKVMPTANRMDPRHKLRFQNEAKILAQLQHVSIVSVIAVGEEQNIYYFAMQYVDGVTADDLIHSSVDDTDAQKSPPGTASDADEDADGSQHERLAWFLETAAGRDRCNAAVRIAAEIAEGLAHAHECGVLHRDVKPSNILLDRRGAAHLTDFGLARMLGDDTLTVTGTILGTLRYASPEQLRGAAGGIDERSDIYSLGVTLWEMVTGGRLFLGDDGKSVMAQLLKGEVPRPSRYAPHIPRHLDTVIACAVAQEPADRYPSAQAFADDLRRILDDRPIAARPLSQLEHAFRWANRNRTTATAAIGVLVTMAAVAMIASILVVRANSRMNSALVDSRTSGEKARREAAVAEASVRKTEALLYAADMALAGAAWEKNEPAHVRMILDRYAAPGTDGKGSLTAGRRQMEWRFLDRQIQPASELLYQCDQSLYVLEPTPTGDQFLSAGKDGIVRWHNGATGTVVHSLAASQLEINSLSLSPSGKMLATAGDDGTIKIWDLASRTLLKTINAFESVCNYAKFTSDSEIVSGGTHAPCRLFNVADGELVREYVPATPELPAGRWRNSLSVSVAAEQNRFWTVESWNDSVAYQGVYEWDARTAQSRRITDDLELCVILCNRSRTRLIVGAGQHVRIVDAQSGAEFDSIRLGNVVEILALSPGEDRLVIGDRNGQLHVWDMTLDKPRSGAAKVSETISVHDGTIYSAAFAPDGKSVLTAGSDGSIRRTQVGAKRTPFQEIAWLEGRRCAPIPGADQVVATSPLAIYELSSGRMIKQLSAENYSEIAVDADGSQVAGGAAFGIGVWSLPDGELIRQAPQHRRWISQLAFSSDASYLASDSHDGVGKRIDVLDLSTGEMYPYSAAPDVISAGLNCCVNSGLIAWLPKPSKLVCWSIPDKSILWETAPFSRNHRAMAISPDRKRLLTADRRILTLYDCVTGRIVYETPCEYSVKAIAFVDEGSRFVTGGDQGELSIWHADLGQHLIELANLGVPIASLHAIEDGFLASALEAGEGHSRRVWKRF